MKNYFIYYLFFSLLFFRSQGSTLSKQSNKPIGGATYSSLGFGIPGLAINTTSPGDGIEYTIINNAPGVGHTFTYKLAPMLLGSGYSVVIKQGSTTLWGPGTLANTATLPYTPGLPALGPIKFIVTQTSIRNNTFVLDSTIRDSIIFTPQATQTLIASNDKYQYGFNGKMKDNEWTGIGNHINYGYRGYDPRIAKFGSVDPLTKKYPWYTPYQFAGNSPIKNIDIEGLEECSADAAQMRLQTGYLKGTVTEQQLKDQANAQGLGALIGAAIVADYFTGGRTSAFLWSSYLWGTQNHTESKIPAVAAKQRAATRNGVIAGVTGYATGKLLGGIYEAATAGAKAIGTPYGFAVQSSSNAATAAATQVENGATLYRFGTLGKSAAAEAQFWSLENPAQYIDNPAVFAQKFGIPVENLQSGQFFIESGTLPKGTPFITREAPGVGTNNGGAIEVVTDPNAVKLGAFNTVTH